MYLSRRISAVPVKSEGFSGELVKIDPEVKFLEGQQVDGVHLLTDLDKAKQLQVLIGNYAHGSTDFFPAMWPVSLCTDNIHQLESQSYVMAPKPVGPRFLLYIDSSGRIFLENMTQHFFLVDEDHAVNMRSYDGRSITDTLLDGIITKEKSLESTETDTPNGQLTYVIQDAIRCNGKDLTGMGILQRIAYVKEEIIKPRKFYMEKRKNMDEQNEAFQLDIAKYKDTGNAEEFLSSGFEERFKYPFRAFEFLPKEMGYVSNESQRGRRVLQWAENDLYECSFKLKIPSVGKEGILLVGGPFRKEKKYASITLTDDIRKYDGQIIDCFYADHQWNFQKVRLDRKHPNGYNAVNGKVHAKEQSVDRHRLLTSLDKSKGCY